MKLKVSGSALLVPFPAKNWPLPRPSQTAANPISKTPAYVVYKQAFAA